MSTAAKQVDDWLSRFDLQDEDQFTPAVATVTQQGVIGVAKRNGHGPSVVIETLLLAAAQLAVREDRVELYRFAAEAMLDSAAEAHRRLKGAKH